MLDISVIDVTLIFGHNELVPAIRDVDLVLSD